MMAKLTFLFVTLMLTTATTFAKPLADDRQLSDSIQFAVDLYQTIRDEISNENIIISPLSVQTAMGLVLMGAGGQTAEEIVNGLHFKTNDRSAIASHFQQLLERFNDGETLNIANKVYVQTGNKLNSEFNEVARQQFDSEAENINFSDNVKAANTINAWVEEKTNNKIKDLYVPDALSADTQMVLVNAVYFKGLWENAFQKKLTRKSDFWISENDSVKVDMMMSNSLVRFGINNELNARIVMLPYKNSDMSMMIILPNTRTGLSELEKKLETYDFSSVTSQLRETEMDIIMPKFTIETSLKLKEVLKKMGMNAMFNNNADFLNLLSSGENLKIDEVIHKAYINVDEEGTEAAAATGTSMVKMSLPPRMKVDHPFFFAIVGPYDVPFVGTIRNF